MQKLELLMPAGNTEKLRYALAYGADAVYAGIPIYSLRARENDFNLPAVAEAIRHTHALGKRIYLTMNIYAHNSKVERFLDTFCGLADLKPDGFIMTDVGLITKALKLRPDSIIHLSTQANATNWTTAEFWRDHGVRRIILPRELSIREIAEFHRRVPDIELECFVHGAICMAYSGRCLISNYMNHRDANQGTCTNSCRWEYKIGVEKNSLHEAESEFRPGDLVAPYLDFYVKADGRSDEKFPIFEDEHGTYMMNSKDLCAIELLGELAESGVVSFKVEGRTKSVFYCAVIARSYRRAIDDLIAGRPFNPDNLQEVVTTANRTLMTGFFEKRPEEYGINYTDGASAPLTARFAGAFEYYDQQTGLAWIRFANKVSVGDRVQWITPDESFEQVVPGLYSERGESVDSAHGGMLLGMPVDFVPAELSLLRSFFAQPNLALHEGTGLSV